MVVHMYQEPTPVLVSTLVNLRYTSRINFSHHSRLAVIVDVEKEYGATADW
jgi:hypothetical protein